MDMLGIFKNIIKNDYIYEIEKTLEKKGTTNEIKSLVMDTLFKIEETYPNYKRIKVDVLEKKDYIREIVVALKKVDNIYTMNMQEKDILKCVTDTKIEKNARGYYDIQIYHNNLSLLYALQTIINEEYGINEQPCSSAFDKILKIGGIYSNIEILRDFSGWNWNRNKIKNFNIYYDIIYKNLLLILGIDKMIELKKTRQCIHFMKKYLLKKYKNDNVEKLMEILKEIVFVMSSEEEKRLEIEANKKIIDMYMAMKDIKKFMQKVNEEKKKNNKLIAEYDKILNSHNVLEREYNEYLKAIEKSKNEDNSNGSLNIDSIIDILDIEEDNIGKVYKEEIKNIELFSIQIFEKRKKVYNKNLELSKIGNPENYVEHKRILEEKIKYILDYEKVKGDAKKEEELLENLMIEYQKIVYDMLEDRIEAIYTNEEVIDEIYRQRYIRYQNVLKDKYIYQISDLYQKMDKILHLIVAKAMKFDVLERVSEEENTNYAAVSPALKTEVLSLEEVKVAIYTGKITLLCIYDGNVLIKEIELFDVDPKLISIPTKKKIKLFKGKK
jgi:hypothetical protein